MRCLIVDDRMLAANALAETVGTVAPGALVESVFTAQEALQRVAETRPDVVFLDIEIPGTDGFELAERCAELAPETNVVFVTGYPDYALEAHRLYPSGFLVKPVSDDDVRGVLAHLRKPIEEPGEKLLRVQCFGNFEVFHDDHPLAFGRGRSKELMAYLVDRRGAQVSAGEITAVLWEDMSLGPSKGAQLRTLIHDLRCSLDAVGAADVLVRRRGSAAVDCSLIDCDYFRLCAGDPLAAASFTGEYMSQYSWAEATAASLARR